MAFVYSIDEFGNIHTDDVTHITSNRGDGIIWRHAHEIFDDHIHTTSLSSDKLQKLHTLISKSEIFKLYDTNRRSIIIYIDEHLKLIDTIIHNLIIFFRHTINTIDYINNKIFIKLLDAITTIDTQFNHPITYAIHQIQTIDGLILNPVIEFLTTIVTSDVVMIAKDIIKRIHNTATATKQKLTNAITIRRQL